MGEVPLQLGGRRGRHSRGCRAGVHPPVEAALSVPSVASRRYARTVGNIKEGRTIYGESHMTPSRNRCAVYNSKYRHIWFYLTSLATRMGLHPRCFRVQGSMLGFRGFRAWDSGIRDQGSGFRVQGVECVIQVQRMYNFSCIIHCSHRVVARLL